MKNLRSWSVSASVSEDTSETKRHVKTDKEHDEVNEEFATALKNRTTA